MASNNAHPALTRFERYELRQMVRRDLRGAPFNPRVLSARAKRLLRDNLSRIGLLEPPIYNLPTKYLIGGHQRLAILDSLEGHQDYRLTVAVTHLSDADAKAQMIFLNNPLAQGWWDLDRLAALLADPSVSADEAGLEPFDLQMLLSDEQLAQLSQGTTVNAAALAEPPSPVAEAMSRLDEIKAARQRGKQRMAERNDADFLVTVVFPNRTEKEAFLRRLNHDPWDRTIPAEDLLTWLASAAPPS